MVKIFLTTICFTLACLILFSLPAYAELAEKVMEQKKAVVTISVEDKEKKQLASARGFVLDQRGIIATNCLIIAKWLEKSQNMLKVKTESGLLFPVRELISSRCENNLALIKIDTEEPAFVAVDREYKLEQGDHVFVLSEKTTDATRVADITLKEVITKGRLYRISHPVAPELSGSPLFNSKGKVVGAAVVLPGGGKPYSAAVSLAPILKQLDSYKKPGKGERNACLPETGGKRPETADEFIACALTCYKQGQYAKAIDAYKQALQMEPDSVSVYNKLGVTYLIYGDFRSACEVFQKALSLDSKDPVAHFNLGLAYTLMGDKIKAYEYYEILKTLDEERAEKLRELIN
jgi:tetratricopeptide (TPR) repeat protein